MTHADLPEALTVPVSRCLDGLVAGWRLFLIDPARWAVIALIFVFILAAIGVVPLIGWAITLVAFPVLGAGMISVADDAAAGRPIRIDGLFDGLRRMPGKHITVGIFHLGGALIIGFVAVLIGGSAALTGLLIGPLAAVGLATGGIMLAVMVFMALWIGLLMAIWFAPALVLFHDAEPIDALGRSAQACARNLPCVFVVALSIYLLVWIAMLPAGLGLLVLLPVLAGAQHAAYLDIFAQRPALPGPPSSDA